MMKKLLTFAPALAVLAFAMTSCWPAQTYDKNGISFEYPGGWAVTVDEFANNRGYLSLEKNDATPKASIVFGWMVSEAKIGSDMMMQNVLRSMQVTDKMSDIVAEPAVDAEYGAYPARAVAYTATIDGTPCAGTVWVFSAEGRIVNVAVREGADKANVAAFKKIKDSFTLK